tara:strand:- start:64 stop:561 length:498 start_codon:yes stop_codon:yes gene_type:complete
MTVDATVGGATSDTLATLAEYQAYGALRGLTLGATDAADEINLLKAMDYLSRKYVYVGVRTTSTQALVWPRVTGLYVEGYQVATDTIPLALKDAQCEMAYLIQGGATPFATVSTGATLSTRVKAGSVESETTYQGARETPRFVAVEGLLAPYIVAGAGQVSMVRG